MSRLVVIRSYPSGPRIWVIGQRTHHGATGCALVGYGIARRNSAIIIAGLLMAAHDRRDFRIWFKRERPGIRP